MAVPASSRLTLCQRRGVEPIEIPSPVLTQRESYDVALGEWAEYHHDPAYIDDPEPQAPSFRDLGYLVGLFCLFHVRSLIVKAQTWVRVKKVAEREYLSNQEMRAELYDPKTDWLDFAALVAAMIVLSLSGLFAGGAL